MFERMPALGDNSLDVETRVQRLRDDAEALLAIMREQFGENDSRTTRAGELCDALQRLEWNLERRPQAAQALAASNE